MEKGKRRLLPTDLFGLSFHRLHAQALTLAALAGATVVEYYDHKSGAKARCVADFLESEPQGRKG